MVENYNYSFGDIQHWCPTKIQRKYTPTCYYGQNNRWEKDVDFDIHHLKEKQLGQKADSKER